MFLLWAWDDLWQEPILSVNRLRGGKNNAKNLPGEITVSSARLVRRFFSLYFPHREACCQASVRCLYIFPLPRKISAIGTFWESSTATPTRMPLNRRLNAQNNDLTSTSYTFQYISLLSVVKRKKKAKTTSDDLQILGFVEKVNKQQWFSLSTWIRPLNNSATLHEKQRSRLK